MNRPILRLKKRPEAALLTRPVTAPAVVTTEPPLAPGRTQQLICAIETTAKLPPETLALKLLLPKHHRPGRDDQALLPTIAIQLWLEGRLGEATFSRAEERRVIERAAELFGFVDSNANAPLPANGTAPPVAPPPGTREERWQRLRDDMARCGLPLGLIEALASVRPVSRNELTHLMKRGKLTHLSRTYAADLCGWLRLPLQAHQRAPREQRVRDFAQAAQQWEARTPKADTP